MAKVCQIEGCDNIVFSKGFCKYHYPRKPINKVSNKQKEKKNNNILLIEEDWKFYQKCSEVKEHYCFECGKGISEFTTANCHHILPKRNYPELRHVLDNIVILCIECHYQVETNLDFSPKVKELTKQKLLEYVKGSRDN